MFKRKFKFITIFILINFLFLSYAPVFCVDITTNAMVRDFTSDQINIFNEQILKVSKLKMTQEMDKFIQNIDPEIYIVDTGDKFKLSVYGPAIEDYILIVDPNGGIFMPDFGEINVRGLTYSQFKEKFFKFLNKFYKKCKYNLTLVGAKTFKVTLAGEVVRPGSYMINSFYSVTDVLGEAGGLMPNASLFNIGIKRGNSEYKVDIYKSVFLGDKEDKYCLIQGDSICVYSLQNFIRVRGEVNKPGFFEVTGNESLETIIRLAGGFTRDSLPNGIFIERETNNGLEKTIIRIGVNEDKKAFKLMAGDVVVVPTKDIYRQYIIIAGEFKAPEFSIKAEILNTQKTSVLSNAISTSKWQYRISKGETVLDVINACGGLTEKASLRFAQVNRVNEKGKRNIIPINLQKLLYKNDLSQNIELIPGDTFAIPPVLDNVYVVGEVRSPGVFPYIGGLSIKEYFMLAGGPGAYASLNSVKVIRGDLDKPEVHNVNLSKIFYGKPTADFKIYPEDIIYVSRTEFVSISSILSIITSVVNVYALGKIFQ